MLGVGCYRTMSLPRPVWMCGLPCMPCLYCVAGARVVDTLLHPPHSRSTVRADWCQWLWKNHPSSSHGRVRCPWVPPTPQGEQVVAVGHAAAAAVGLAAAAVPLDSPAYSLVCVQSSVFCYVVCVGVCDHRTLLTVGMLCTQLWTCPPSQHSGWPCMVFGCEPLCISWWGLLVAPLLCFMAGAAGCAVGVLWQVHYVGTWIPPTPLSPVPLPVPLPVPGTSNVLASPALWFLRSLCFFL